MPVSIPQIQDKKHRVCSHCRFKKVKCDGGSPCSTCLKENVVCFVWVHLEDQRATTIRQGCINGYIMQGCMLHQAIVDIIQKGVIPDVPAEALTSPHKLLSAMGVIDKKENATWKHNLEEPWAQLALNAATTHPQEKTPHAPRGPNNAGPNKADKENAAARKQRKQGVRRQQQPTCPDTPAPGFSMAAQPTDWYNAAAVAPAQQQLGYNQPFIGQAYGHAVESTFNSGAPSAAFPPAPGFFAGFPYNSQANPILLDSPLSPPSTLPKAMAHSPPTPLLSPRNGSSSSNGSNTNSHSRLLPRPRPSPPPPPPCLPRPPCLPLPPRRSPTSSTCSPTSPAAATAWISMICSWMARPSTRSSVRMKRRPCRQGKRNSPAPGRGWTRRISRWGWI